MLSQWLKLHGIKLVYGNGLASMNLQTHQQELEAYYRKQIGGRTIFWKDKHKPYLSLYRDRLLKRNAAIAAALPERVERAADLGCGQGDLSAMLAPRAGLVVGMDLAEVMVRTARENLRDYSNVHVLCSPAETLPLRGEVLDAILMADVIEHLVGPLSSLRECRRLLRPGGVMIITTPNAPVEYFWKRFDGTLSAPFRWLRRRSRKPDPPVLEHLFSRRQLSALALDAGFTVRVHRMIGFFPGSEGSGTFGRLLRLIARQKQIREWLVEPVFRGLFSVVERLKIFNNRQFLVLLKPLGH